MSKEKTILIVDLTSTVPVYTAYFCNALNKIGFKTTIAGIERKNETTYIKHLNFEYINWMNRSLDVKLSLLNSIIKFFEYLINWIMLLIISTNYTVVHIQWLPLMQKTSLEFFLLKLLLKRNKNVFYTVHNVLPHDNFNDLVKKRYKKIYDLIPNLVLHTEKTKVDLIENFGISSCKLIIMPHGPIYGDFGLESNDRSENILGVIGTIKPYKGIEDAIILVKKLTEKGMDIRLLLAGSGSEDYIKKISDLIIELRLEKSVIQEYRYLSVDEMISKYQNVRGILAPYKNIDQSGAVITSLALGTPVIGYSVGGLNDLIINEYNGFLVEPNNVDQLAKAVDWLLNQDSIVLYDNCRKSLENKSWDVAAMIMKDKYFKCTGSAIA